MSAADISFDPRIVTNISVYVIRNDVPYASDVPRYFFSLLTLGGATFTLTPDGFSDLMRDHVDSGNAHLHVIVQSMDRAESAQLAEPADVVNIH